MRRSKAAVLVAVLVTAAGTALSAPAQARAAGSSYSLSKVVSADGKSHVLRWNPCQEITYQVNVKGVAGTAGKTEAAREVKLSVRRLARASGLDFRFTGRTSFVPRTLNYKKQPADLVVAFVNPAQTNIPLAGPTAGMGGMHAVLHYEGPGWSLHVLSGYVVIDHAQTKKWSTSATRRGITRPGLLAHELGHAVGLEHVADQRQIMYPALGPKSPYTYASGDLAGLRRVGRPAGCIQ